MSTLKIVNIQIEKLIPYARNARTHSDKQVAQIAASIKEFGFNLEWHFCIENDCYVADSSGNVFSVCVRRKSRAGNPVEIYETKLLAGSTEKDGYRTYRMVVGGKKRHIKGHRLVANAFLGESKKPCVNHKDGNKKNNAISNLEWVTVAENNRHAIDTGLWHKGMANYKRKIHPSNYMSIYLMRKRAGFRVSEIAKMNNVCNETIGLIIRKLDNLFGGLSA